MHVPPQRPQPASPEEGGSAGDPLRLVHVAAWARTRGGVETLLARHARADAAHGWEARQFALFDRGIAPDAAYSSLECSWRTTPAEMRARVARAMSDHAGAVVVWHNGWGVPWFADVDGSARRIVVIHDNTASYGRTLPAILRAADGVLCLSESAARAVRQLAPILASARVDVLPLPIEPPGALASDRPSRPEWVIGCAGRLVRPQKRWDRLVPFVRALREAGAAFRLEIISDGPLRPWLERQLQGATAVRFLGWQSQHDYWRRLQEWDAAVFFSDHEGGPIVLLEAMAAGVIPVYPAIGGSLGDDVVPRLDPRCYYSAGDARAAARAVLALQSLPAGELAALRRRAQSLVQPHLHAAYEEKFSRFARRIAGLPRVSRPPDGSRPARWTDWVPLGLVTRCFPRALSC